MGRRSRTLVHLCLLWLLVALAAWPAFVAAGTLLGLWAGEARQIDAWALEPRRTLLADFLDGWRASLPVAAAAGLVAVADHLLLSHHRVTRLFRGALLPIAGIVVAYRLYADPYAALPTLALTGLLLAVPYRVFAGWRSHTIGAS